MFQESTVTGILFLIAVFINSRTAAIYAILGALLPIPIAILLGVDSESLNAGLMGYNWCFMCHSFGRQELERVFMGIVCRICCLSYSKWWE